MSKKASLQPANTTKIYSYNLALLHSKALKKQLATTKNT